MERTGIEPVTSGLQIRRGAPHWFSFFPDLAYSSQAPLAVASLLALFPGLAVPDSFQPHMQSRNSTLACAQ